MDVSLATFNLYNLQSPGGKLYRGKVQMDDAAYRDKIAWTASMLTSLDADVIAFQELWSYAALESVFEKAGLLDDYHLVGIKHNLALEEGQEERNTPWYSAAVAAAVRKTITIEKVHTYKAFPSSLSLKKELPDDLPREDRTDDEVAVTIDRFSRTILRLDLSIGTAPKREPFSVYCTHLKSKLPTYLGLDLPEGDTPEISRERGIVALYQNAVGSALSTIRRTAEATALRVILDRQMLGTDEPVVVLGDMNDGRLSNTLSVLTGQPKHLFEMTKRQSRERDAGLYLATHLEQYRNLTDTQYSHEFENVKEVLDHVLVSEQFVDVSARRVWRFKGMRIWNDHLDDHEGKGPFPSSDHGIVRAAFAYDPYRD